MWHLLTKSVGASFTNTNLRYLDWIVELIVGIESLVIEKSLPLSHGLAAPGVGDELGREGVAHEAEVAEATDAVADLAEQLWQV